MPLIQLKGYVLDGLMYLDYLVVCLRVYPARAAETRRTIYVTVYVSEPHS